MTAIGVRVERLHCPIDACPWTHDDPGPGTGADVRLPAVELSAKPGTFADAMAEATYRALLAHALGQENVIREHLATHSLEEWVREIMRLRAQIIRVRALADDPEAAWHYVTPHQIRDALDADEIARRQAIAAANLGGAPRLGGERD